jgi:hypothetical protein
MNALEKHIHKNRDELDKVETPDIQGMWAEIAPNIPGQQQKRRAIIIGLRKIAIAASFMLVGGFAVWVFMNQQNKKNSSLATFYPELLEIEDNYRRTIAKKEATIPFDSLDQFLFEEILDELETLEEMKATTLEDLPQYSKNERVVNALMKYYERKIQILERLSNEYQKSKRHEKKREIQI